MHLVCSKQAMFCQKEYGKKTDCLCSGVAVGSATPGTRSASEAIGAGGVDVLP
jgi:hypothetical protein